MPLGMRVMRHNMLFMRRGYAAYAPGKCAFCVGAGVWRTLSRNALDYAHYARVCGPVCACMRGLCAVHMRGMRRSRYTGLVSIKSPCDMDEEKFAAPTLTPLAAMRECGSASAQASARPLHRFTALHAHAAGREGHGAAWDCLPCGRRAGSRGASLGQRGGRASCKKQYWHGPGRSNRSRCDGLTSRVRLSVREPWVQGAAAQPTRHHRLLTCCPLRQGAQGLGRQDCSVARRTPGWLG